MGYKLAGCEVIGANDIDPEMAYHYKLNLNPRLYFLCPIGDLLTAELPDELFNLDILDGSPPCSTFSMAAAGKRHGARRNTFEKDNRSRFFQTSFLITFLWSKGSSLK